jgi:hypothetical protein
VVKAADAGRIQIALLCTKEVIWVPADQNDRISMMHASSISGCDGMIGLGDMFEGTNSFRTGVGKSETDTEVLGQLDFETASVYVPRDDDLRIVLEEDRIGLEGIGLNGSMNEGINFFRSGGESKKNGADQLLNSTLRQQQRQQRFTSAAHHAGCGAGTKSTELPLTTKRVRPAAAAETYRLRLPIAFAFVGMMMAAVLGPSVSAAAASPPPPVADLFQGTCSR